MRALFGIGLALSLITSTAAAQKDPASTTARTHLDVGVKLYSATPPDYAGALAEFEEAYRAKPSPGIRRNIALCLKALHRYPEAIDALEKMQEEGSDRLTPEVREATEKTIAELYAQIATVHVRVVPHVARGQAPPKVDLSVDDALVLPEKYGKPLRLMPGERVFKARADGFFEAVQTVNLAAGGKDIPVVIEMVAIEIIQKGTLTVRANVSSAVISIDRIMVGTERWTGDLRAGMHRIDVVAQGYPPYVVQVDVPPNESRALPVDLSSTPANVPAPYEPVKPLKKPDRNWFLTGGVVLQFESLRFGPGLDEPGGGTRRPVGGAAFAISLGRKLAPFFDGLVFAEVGGLAPSSYASPKAAFSQANVGITSWALAPELRVHTLGSVRGFAGLGLGLEGQIVSADLGYAQTDGSAVKKVSGGSAAGMLLLELGGQIDLGRAFLEAAAFADLHGVGGAKDSLTTGRFFLSSPAVRGGVRLLVGYHF